MGGLISTLQSGGLTPLHYAKMWYQVKKDCVLYKFKAHEIRRRSLGPGSLAWPA